MRSDQLIPTKKFLEGMLKLILVALIAGSAAQCMIDKAVASKPEDPAYYQIYAGINFDKERLDFVKNKAILAANKQCQKVQAKTIIVGVELRATEDRSSVVAKVQYNCVWSSI